MQIPQPLTNGLTRSSLNLAEKVTIIKIPNLKRWAGNTTDKPNKHNGPKTIVPYRYIEVGLFQVPVIASKTCM